MDSILLDGGLDLVHARPAIPAGKLRGCLNYEVGWQRGYSRIDGFERFDGRVSPSATDYWVVTLPTGDITGTPINKPTNLVWTLGDETDSSGMLVEYADSTGTSTLIIVFRKGRLRPPYGAVISASDEAWSFVLDAASVSVDQLAGIQETHEDFLAVLSRYAEILRGEVMPVPGGGTIVGLHYHEDQLYAVRDTALVALLPGEETVLKAGMYVYNSVGQLGEVVAADAINNRFHIAAATAEGFSASAGDSISIALTIRFTSGAGEFNNGDLVSAAVWAGEVGLVERRDGSFDSGNALGAASFIHGPDTPPALAETITNNTSTGTLVVESILFAGRTSAATIDATFPKAEVAYMWRSTDTGWKAATSGRTIPFINGEQDPTSDLPVAQTLVGAATVAFQSTTTADPDWTDPGNIAIPGPVAQVAVAGVPAVPLKGSTDYITVNNFNLGVLDNAEITGLGLLVSGYEAFAGGQGTLRAALSSGGYAGTRSGVLPEIPAPGAEIEIGGEFTQWSPGGHTPAQVNAAGFGFDLFVDTWTQSTTVIDTIKVKVYFTSRPGSKIYMWDGAADIGALSVESVVVQEGDWGDSASGYFRLSDWDIVDVPSGVSVYSEPGGPGGGGFLIADLDGGVSRPTLPGSKLLDAEHSRYQMISYNFFATEDKNAIYGVSGAGPAFWYDGKTLDFILTGVAEDKDKPRHVALHENRLHLGYIWGEVYASGPDPLNFDAATGLGATYGFGDKITGLMPAAGKALAVFTESATHVLIGAVQGFGEAALETVEQRVINHKVGAIEYTVQNIGNRAIFASFRGIETLETMDQYSDFFTAPLTYDVSPWLLERLQAAAGVETTDKSVVNSVVIRNKNQYRLFFADGHVLTLTYVGPEKEPQNTIQKYWLESDEAKFARLYATASGVTTNGQDRAFFSVEERPATYNSPVQVVGELIDFVYEFDRGRSFDGGSIRSEFTLTHYYAQDPQSGAPAPMLAKRFNTLQVHGTAVGYAGMRLSRSVNYEDLDDQVLPYEPVPFGALENKPETIMHPKYSKARMTARGFSVSLHFTHVSDVEFPHVVQMITFLNDTILGPDR